MRARARPPQASDSAKALERLPAEIRLVSNGKNGILQRIRTHGGTSERKLTSFNGDVFAVN